LVVNRYAITAAPTASSGGVLSNSLEQHNTEHIFKLSKALDRLLYTLLAIGYQSAASRLAVFLPAVVITKPAGQTRQSSVIAESAGPSRALVIDFGNCRCRVGRASTIHCPLCAISGQEHA